MNLNKVAKIIVAVAVVGLLSTSAFAASTTGSDPLTGINAPQTNSAWTNVQGMVGTVLGFVYWCMYIVAAVLITMSGFKLKAGDIPGFAKTLIGGMAVFGSKFLVQALFASVNS
jgi:hypothetical protein